MAADDEREAFPRAPTEAGGERVAKIEVRLENGQKEFMALREEQRAQRATMEQMAKDLAPKPMSRLQLVSFVVGPLVLLGGYVWSAARYPDRVEFNAAQGAATETARALDLRMNRLEAAQALQAKDLQTIGASADRNEKALDKLADKLERQLAKGK